MSRDFLTWSQVLTTLLPPVRFGPDFLIPITGLNNSPGRYVKCGMLGALASCGRVLNGTPAWSTGTLDYFVKTATRPLVVFVEGTTSNNVSFLRTDETDES